MTLDKIENQPDLNKVLLNDFNKMDNKEEHLKIRLYENFPCHDHTLKNHGGYKLFDSDNCLEIPRWG